MDALILAGGEDRRFLFHKRLAEIHGKRLIEITSSLLRSFVNINTREDLKQTTGG
jgi:molybdopterin-guanine dinucleotide biosynthesis protein A